MYLLVWQLPSRVLSFDMLDQTFAWYRSVYRLRLDLFCCRWQPQSLPLLFKWRWPLHQFKLPKDAHMFLSILLLLLVLLLSVDDGGDFFPVYDLVVPQHRWLAKCVAGSAIWLRSDHAFDLLDPQPAGSWMRGWQRWQVVALIHLFPLFGPLLASKLYDWNFLLV